jgi:N-acetyl-gamma-glutamyl-phosphate reductase
MLNAAIIGGTGYTGKYLLQYCSQHPLIDKMNIYAKTSAGRYIYDIFPELVNMIDNIKVNTIDDLADEYDVYFIALPHGKSIEVVESLISNDKLIIDLGSDFRLDDSLLYEKWYGINHPFKEFLNNKIYGLAETAAYNKSINLIANPGCYPTSALLSLIPIVKDHSEKINSISINSYSGTSGAGKKADINLLLSEMEGNVKAYNVNNHRHQPEIEQELSKYGKIDKLSFTTHLLPIARGIYTTSSIHLIEPINEKNIKESFLEVYEKKQFIRLREAPPSLNWVVNTNFCDLSISVKEKVIIVNCAIDNLIKGASGQAIQNLNNYFGWDESLGLVKYYGINNSGGNHV